jgi:hypothetical protein
MVDVEASSMGGAKPGYIALRVKREPLDQTDMKNNVDAILGGGGGNFWKLIGRGPHSRPGGTMVGPASLSRAATLWCPLKPSRVVFIMVKFGSF